MGVKRIVDTNFWNDDKVVDLFSPEDKLFMLYLMTNPHTTQLGIYPINKKNMAFELGYSVDTVNVLLERFENKYNIIKYSNETNEIAIKNYLKYSIMKGGKPVEDLLNKEISQVKDKSLITYIFSNIKDYTNLNETVNKIINININDNDVSYHDTYHDTLSDVIEEIINYLNLKANTNYKCSTPKTKTLIKARIKEGFNIDDFKLVIDKKCYTWLGTKMEQYLRPETLFGNKFEGYLNEKVKMNVQDAISKSDSFQDMLEKGLI